MIPLSQNVVYAGLHHSITNIVSIHNTYLVQSPISPDSDQTGIHSERLSQINEHKGGKYLWKDGSD